MINTFKNIRSPQVQNEYDIFTILDYIENPEKNVLENIERAREIFSLGNTIEYHNIKSMLPCFCFNFSFNEYKKNENIKEPTGFIYIDIDGTVEIDLTHPYIFASWLSLSGNGLTVLVKVAGLTLDNFSAVYNEVSSMLNVQSDNSAKKATQYTVHSYDPQLYVNTDSKTYYPISNTESNLISTNLEESKNVHFTNNREKKRKVASKVNIFDDLRYNNLDEIDFKGQNFLVYEDYEYFSKLFIPPTIPEGKRNTKLSTITHQLLALNPQINYSFFYRFIISINETCCETPLPENELTQIIKSKWHSHQKENLKPIKKWKRRIVFNPDFKSDKTEKMLIVRKEIGRIKSTKTKLSIKNCIENWNICEYGKITQTKIKECSGKGRTTLSKYWNEFKDRVSELNNLLKTDYCNC